MDPEFSKRPKIIHLFAMAAMLISCESTPEKVCAPGATQSCVCANGSGAQVCGQDGTQWEECGCAITDGGQLPDIEINDATATDLDSTDVELADSFVPDSDLPDTWIVDASMADSAALDATTPDTMAGDATANDALTTDAVRMDATPHDAGGPMIDGSLPDISANDATLTDTSGPPECIPEGCMICSGNVLVPDPASCPDQTCSTDRGSTLYLSDLAFEIAGNGYGPVERDMSSGEMSAEDGHALTINQVTFAKGLGTHASSEITFNLAGHFTSFSGFAGIDDEVAEKGNASFSIFIDGVSRFSSGAMTGNDDAKSFDIDVTGGLELRLVTDMLGDYSFDHTDWADLRLTTPDTFGLCIITSTCTPSGCLACLDGILVPDDEYSAETDHLIRRNPITHSAHADHFVN